MILFIFLIDSLVYRYQMIELEWLYADCWNHEVKFKSRSINWCVLYNMKNKDVNLDCHSDSFGISFTIQLYIRIQSAASLVASFAISTVQLHKFGIQLAVFFPIFAWHIVPNSHRDVGWQVPITKDHVFLCSDDFYCSTDFSFGIWVYVSWI